MKNMKKSNIIITFDDEKLSAVKRFMSKKDKVIESELTEYIMKLYEKFVPSSVREYIEDRTVEQDGAK